MSEKKAFAPDLPSGYLKLKILKPPDVEALDTNSSQSEENILLDTTVSVNGFEYQSDAQRYEMA